MRQSRYPGSAIPRDADSASRPYLALVIADRTDSVARAIMTPAGGRDVQPVLKQLSARLRDANLDSARVVGAHTFRVSFLIAA